MGVRIVCFDLGGVLVRLSASWQESCEHAGVTYDPVLGSDGFRAVWREVTNAHQTGRCSRVEADERLAEASGGRLTAATFARLHEVWIRGVYSGIEQLVDELNDRADVVTACLSNTNEEHWAELNDARPEASYRCVAALEHKFASHHLGIAKPDPAIYRAVQEGLGAAGGELLFFDDVEANVTAARVCGWSAEHIDSSRETAPQLRARLAEHGVL